MEVESTWVRLRTMFDAEMNQTEIHYINVSINYRIYVNKREIRLTTQAINSRDFVTAFIIIWFEVKSNSTMSVWLENGG